MEQKKGFYDLISSKEKPVLVDFFATWCGPCQALSPIIQEVSREMEDKMIVIKVDVDKNPAVAQKFGIRGLPTMILFKGGEPVWRQSGLMTKRDISSILQKFAS
jgi:thioredoxin 1